LYFSFCIFSTTTNAFFWSQTLCHIAAIRVRSVSVHDRLIVCLQAVKSVSRSTVWLSFKQTHICSDLCILLRLPLHSNPHSEKILSTYACEAAAERASCAKGASAANGCIFREWNENNIIRQHFSFSTAKVLVFVHFVSWNFSFYFVFVFLITVILVLVFWKWWPIILVLILIFVTKITLITGLTHNAPHHCSYFTVNRWKLKIWEGRNSIKVKNLFKNVECTLFKGRPEFSVNAWPVRSSTQWH